MRDLLHRILDGMCKIVHRVDAPFITGIMVGREDLKLKKPRMMAVLDPIRLVIDNYPEGETEWLEAENNLENEALHFRKFNLPGRRIKLTFPDYPVIKGPVILKFQRTDRMRDLPLS